MTENDKIRITLADVNDTLNFFVWGGKGLLAKIWLYPDGSIYYRRFAPELSPLILLRDSQIRIEKDIKFNTPPKKTIPMEIKFELKDSDTDQESVVE